MDIQGLVLLRNNRLIINFNDSAKKFPMLEA